MLCYHAVSDRWTSPLAVTTEMLRRQLEVLVRRGYRGATFEQAVAAPPAARTLAVTFDDGYRSMLSHALPVLQGLGLPGTVFVPTDFVGSREPMRWPGIEHWVGGPFEEELVPLSWEELGSLQAAGWEIGSHTRSHPRLSQLADRDLERELVDSRRACEARLGACHTIALPYGDGDDRVVAAAGAAGYRAVAGLPGRGMPAPAGWPRVGVYPVDRPARFAVKVSRPVRRLRGSRLARTLERVVHTPSPGGA